MATGQCTLLEIMIVLVVVGVLTTVSLPRDLNPAKKPTAVLEQ